MSDNQATPMNPNSPTPLYLQIKEYCQDSITSGDYPEHTRLPSERRLAERFQVSRMTVTKALKGLEQEGWLYTRMGKGTFVASRTKINQEVRPATDRSPANGRGPASRSRRNGQAAHRPCDSGVGLHPHHLHPARPAH
jgi:DNA-binding GntR family transcriptional regulator